MRHFFIFSTFLLAAFMPLAVAQTDGWTSNCPPAYPSVSEVMIDACGDEFRSEYVVLRTNLAPFDIRNFGLSVSNPFNSAFIGSVVVTNNSANVAALQALNTAAGAACGYGTVFRNAFSTPYNGIIPPNSTVLVFNNRDSTDVTYLSPDALSRLCGSKVFVVFGTLTAQSRGVSIFRNYPQNGSCGTTGCLRKIDFAFNGQTCSQFTYDIKKLPNLNTTNPPVGFNEGSYITPNANGTLTYGGGNLTGAGVTCMPTVRLACVIPPVPTYGNGFWNVLAFDGQNTYNTTDFKGFYTAADHDPTTIPADTINGSFEFNTAFDGWKPNSAPSEAVAADGAKATYDGCNVRADSFSVLAKREGFPCGFYKIFLQNYDDNARIRLDADGNGVFEFDQSYAAPGCSTGCGTMVWQGDLGTRSRMEIYGSENRGSFNLHIVFQKDTVGHPSVKINILGTTAVACGGAPTGSISTSVTGGFAPYTMTWRGPTTIPSGVFLPLGLPSGIFHAIATDVLGCMDSAQILVPQTNAITVQAFGDATFCPNSTATLRGAILGGTPPVTTNWLTSASETVLSASLNYSLIVSKSIRYILRATDASGCVKTDTVDIKTYNVQKIRVTVTPNDTICNDETTVFTARGSNNYTWASFPQIGTSALNPQNGTATLYALFLPAPVYTFYAEGQDVNGCRDTGSVKVWINPLPVVTITPVIDTLCNDATPYALVGTPATGGRFYSRTCGNCVQNGFFYPNLANIGGNEVQHEFIDANGCRNAPSILINVKNCLCPSNVPTSINRSICLGDSVRIKNIFYKTTGLFRDTFPKVNNCDSIVILNLVVNNKSTTRLTVKVCTPSATGIDTVFLRNVNTCDSMLITTKMLSRRDTTPLNQKICRNDSFRFGTIWLKTAGVFTRILQNTEGCDSTLILTLQLVKNDTTIVQQTTCNSNLLGNRTRVLRNSRGCDSVVITQTRFVPSTMRIVLTVSQSISCNGGSNGSVKISSTQNVTPQYVALWSNGSKGPQIDSLRVGTYTVVVTDSAGCSVQDSIRLTEPPPIVVKATGIAPRCYNESLGGFKIDSIQGGTAPYIFIFKNMRFAIPVLPFKVDSVRLGFPTFQIVDNKGCNVQTTVEIPEAPDRSLELGSNRAIVLGDSTLLTGFMNFRPKNLQWTWTPKDSSIQCSTCFPTYVKPTESTVYKLVARDSAGCSIDDQITITVNKPRHVFIPTTFSPNNDLVNDRFTIFGDKSVRRVQSFKIFNRWGNPIFDQNDVPLNDELSGWDGSVRGVAMPPDVYVFVVVVEFLDGKILLYKGEVTLIR